MFWQRVQRRPDRAVARIVPRSPGLGEVLVGSSAEQERAGALEDARPSPPRPRRRSAPIPDARRRPHRPRPGSRPVPASLHRRRPALWPSISWAGSSFLADLTRIRAVECDRLPSRLRGLQRDRPIGMPPSPASRTQRRAGRSMTARLGVDDGRQAATATSFPPVSGRGSAGRPSRPRVATSTTAARAAKPAYTHTGSTLGARTGRKATPEATPRPA